MSSLFNQYISNTYTGVLHAGGTAIPESERVDIFDGEGNKTSLSLGRENNGLNVTGPSNFTGNMTVTESLTIGGGATITGQVNTGTLKVGGVNYPSTNGTVGNLLYQATANTIGFVNPDDIFINDSSDVVTRTTYITHTLPNAIHFNFGNGGDGGTGPLIGVDLSDYVPAQAKAIIGIVMFPSNFIDTEDGYYSIYAARNNSTNQKILISAAGGGEDNGGPMGSASHFYSRITNQRIYLSLNWGGDEPIDTTGWRLCIVAWQE